MPAERVSTSQGTNYIVHTGYKHQSDPNARLETEEPFDVRKGTIRGFLAVLLVVLVAWAAISVFSPGTSSVNAPTEAKSANATEVGMRRDLQR